MAERLGPVVHGTMRGGGYYSAVTRGAKDAIDGAIPLVHEAIRRLPETDPSRPFTLADIGCADGGTSLDSVHQTILGVRARWPRAPSWWSTPTSRATTITASSSSYTA